MKPGEYWFSMQDPAGNPQGYAHLLAVEPTAGALAVEWELKIAFPGGTYEEQRSMGLDEEGRLVEASYRGRGAETHVERRGRRLVGSSRLADGQETAIDREVADDAITGMGFVLAASLPREPGAEITRSDLNEADGVKDEGRVTLRAAGPEPVDLPAGSRGAFKVVLIRADGREMPLWVTESGEIVQADWGGMWMKASEEPTAHLFRPKPPPVDAVETDDRTKLALEGTLEGFTPERLFRHFVDPDLLTRWWPQEAEVDPEVGGRYHMIWKEPAWYLRGEVTAYDPPEELGFTWTWDHRKDAPTLEVRVHVRGIEGGSRLRIVQGPYRDTPEDQKDREGHLLGWRAVTARLEALGRRAEAS